MTIAEALEELRLLASYKATTGEWDEPAARRILKSYARDSTSSRPLRSMPSALCAVPDRLHRITRIRSDFNNLKPRPI